jgi:hypothetical protein
VVNAKDQERAAIIKAGLYEFVHQYQIHVIIVENALSIPVNIPLGVAITEFIEETRFPDHCPSPRLCLGAPALHQQLRQRFHQHGISTHHARHPACCH